MGRHRRRVRERARVVEEVVGDERGDGVRRPGSGDRTPRRRHRDDRPGVGRDGARLPRSGSARQRDRAAHPLICRERLTGVRDRRRCARCCRSRTRRDVQRARSEHAGCRAAAERERRVRRRVHLVASAASRRTDLVPRSRDSRTRIHAELVDDHSEVGRRGRSGDTAIVDGAEHRAVDVIDAAAVDLTDDQSRAEGCAKC